MTTSLKLPRSLSRFDAVMMIIGNMVGIGIFTTTGYIAGYMNSNIWLLLVWILGGIYSFCGALTYAELSTRFPREGGDYHYLNSAFHPLLGFLFGWSTFTVTYTGSIATIAVGFSTYFSNMLPVNIQNLQLSLQLVPLLTITTIKIVAILITLLLTWLNTMGIRRGKQFQNIFTVTGLGIITTLAILGFSSDKGNFDNFTPFLPAHISFEDVSLLGVALIGVIFTYSGWTVIVYIAGEIREPRPNIPSAMWISVGIVTFLYLILNTVYVYATPLSHMAGVVDIGNHALQILFGANFGLFFSVIIMLLVLSTLNSTILSGARIYYAMAREGRFFKVAGKLNSRYKVPSSSLWLQCGWSILLILSGSFDQLLIYTGFMMVLFSSLSALGLFVLRRKQKMTDAIYPVLGYPYVPAVYLCISVWIMLNTLIHRPLESFLGIIIILIGLPFYFFWEKKRYNNTPVNSD